ncbi:MAG: hypothetical protein V3U67_08450 [Gemmatimonadota bacterium]
MTIRGLTARWTVAAALVAAVTVALAARSRGEATTGNTGHADPALEAVVLAETIDFFERKLDGDPYNHVVGNRLIDSHMLRFKLDSDLSHLRRAEQIARSLLPVAPDTASSLARLSLALLAQHKFAGALDAAERAVASDSTDEAALGTLFDAAVASGRYELAKHALAGLEPGTFTWQLRKARWLAFLGETDDAFGIMDRACADLERGSVRRQVVAWCTTMLAGLEWGRSGHEKAEFWFLKSVQTQPDYMAALEGLADIAYAQEDWNTAKEMFERILSEAHPDLYLRIAEVSRALGEVEAAAWYEDEFVRLATAPGAEALNAHPLAVYYASSPMAGDRDRALEIIRHDLDRRRSVETYEVLSWVRLLRGEFDEALEASGQARRWGDPGPSSDYVRARILEALHRPGEAEPLYRRARADRAQLDHHVVQDLWRREARSPRKTTPSKNHG